MDRPGQLNVNGTDSLQSFSHSRETLKLQIKTQSLSVSKNAMVSAAVDAAPASSTVGAVEKAIRENDILKVQFQNRMWEVENNPEAANQSSKGPGCRTGANARVRDGFGVYIWSTGDAYEGEWKNGRMHGKGRFRWENEDVYEGDWVDGKMTGRGRKSMANSDVYDGEWKDDKAHGYGVKIFANGDRHDGLYIMDKRDGYGVYCWTNNDVYKGQWKDGKMRGFGVKHMANGDVYKGEWKDDKAHGRGIKKFACGDLHEGSYQFDKREGFGTYCWANNDRYQGYWKDGRMNGRGVKTMANDDVYDGQWLDDKAHGHGTKTFACGDRHVGEYLDDRRHGYGVYEWANGDRYEGWWAKAEQSGEGTYYYATGDVFKGHWLSGKKHGPGIFTSGTCCTSFREIWEHGQRKERYAISFTPSRQLRTSKECEEQETAILRAEIERLKAKLEDGNAVGGCKISENHLSREVSQPTEMQDRCNICFENTINTVLIRCGHMCACVDCANHLERCPICRQRIVDVVRTYRV